MRKSRIGLGATAALLLAAAAAPGGGQVPSGNAEASGQVKVKMPAGQTNGVGLMGKLAGLFRGSGVSRTRRPRGKRYSASVRQHQRHAAKARNRARARA